MGSVPPSPFLPQRQNPQPVDMIGDLPDIDFFSIPGATPLVTLSSSEDCGFVSFLVTFVVCVTVDDFYEDYVTELGTRNSRRLSGKSKPNNISFFVKSEQPATLLATGTKVCHPASLHLYQPFAYLQALCPAMSTT